MGSFIRSKLTPAQSNFNNLTHNVHILYILYTDLFILLLNKNHALTQSHSRMINIEGGGWERHSSAKSIKAQSEERERESRT